MLTIDCSLTSVRRTVINAIVLWLTASAVSAQDRLGGRFGVVFPLVTHANGATTNIGDDFKAGFPMGITVKTSDKYAFEDGVRRQRRVVGVHAAPEQRLSVNGQTYFVEFVVPHRFQDDSVGDTHFAIGFGVHLGIGF